MNKLCLVVSLCIFGIILPILGISYCFKQIESQIETAVNEGCSEILGKEGK